MKTTYRLPSELRDQMRSAAKEKYNAKAKSRWIRESIEMLLQEDTTLKDVGVGEDLTKNDALDTVDLGETLPDMLDEAVTTLRRQDPLMEGVLASIVRASIRRRLQNGK